MEEEWKGREEEGGKSEGERREYSSVLPCPLALPKQPTTFQGVCEAKVKVSEYSTPLPGNHQLLNLPSHTMLIQQASLLSPMPNGLVNTLAGEPNKNWDYPTDCST